MKRNTTTTALLAVIAVLLGLNLIAKSSPAAVGQAEAGPVQPVPVAIAAQQAFNINAGGTDVWRVFRLWSDGAVDAKQLDWTISPVNVCSPQTDVIDCPVVPIIPGSCTADVTRNGEVEITDFLEVLGQWGPCP